MEFNSKAITDYVQLSELSLDDDKKKRIESLCRGGNLQIYRNIPIIDSDAQIHDDERTEYDIHDSSDIETLIGDGSDWIVKIQGDPEHCLYRSPENGFVYIAENNFHLVSVNEIDFYNHYIGLAGALKWGLSPEPAKTDPQTEPVKSYADYLADVSGTDDSLKLLREVKPELLKAFEFYESLLDKFTKKDVIKTNFLSYVEGDCRHFDNDCFKALTYAKDQTGKSRHRFIGHASGALLKSKGLPKLGDINKRVKAFNAL